MEEKVITVDQERPQQLYEYSARFAADHDSSFIPGRDFAISDQTPSYLLVSSGEVVGAVSLMRTENFLKVNKARFSIFHTVLGTKEAYASLLDAIKPHMEDLQSVYLFIPEKNTETAGIWKTLGFQVERYSFILQKGRPRLPNPIFPEGIRVFPLQPDDLEGIQWFADCINEEFKDLAGHTPSSAEYIQTFFEDQGYIEGGLCLLKNGSEPIGTIGLMHDVDDRSAGEIMAFGILENYRGQALGRNLLRYGFNFLIERGLEPVILSVNGENHGAIRLYESEGFQVTESVVCYNMIPG